jgi:hypothetical protein
MISVLDQQEGIRCGLWQMKQGSIALISVSELAEQVVDMNSLMSMFALARPGVGVGVDDA